jgi:ribosomal protein L29
MNSGIESAREAVTLEPVARRMYTYSTTDIISKPMSELTKEYFDQKLDQLKENLENKIEIESSRIGALVQRHAIEPLDKHEKMIHEDRKEIARLKEAIDLP